MFQFHDYYNVKLWITITIVAFYPQLSGVHVRKPTIKEVDT